MAFERPSRLLLRGMWLTHACQDDDDLAQMLASSLCDSRHVIVGLEVKGNVGM